MQWHHFPGKGSGRWPAAICSWPAASGQLLGSGQASLASGVLPELVERLEAVTSLREAAESWSDVVEGVEQQQRETKEVIKDTEKDLVETREFFDKNIAGIHEKCNLLQNGLQQIK